MRLQMSLALNALAASDICYHEVGTGQLRVACEDSLACSSAAAVPVKNCRTRVCSSKKMWRQALNTWMSMSVRPAKPQVVCYTFFCRAVSVAETDANPCFTSAKRWRPKLRPCRTHWSLLWMATPLWGYLSMAAAPCGMMAR